MNGYKINYRKQDILIENTSLYIALAIIIIIIILVIIILKVIFHNPYEYPYYQLQLDISNKRNVDITEEIEKYILTYRLDDIKEHQQKIYEWEKQTKNHINRSLFKSVRRKQYETIKDTKNTYIVTLQRKQTRYKQKNYVKTPYTVYVTVEESNYSYNDITRCYRKLRKINFETTSKKYHAKNQRKLMTPTLRDTIKKRDNYTCQICGKTMYDEVGLHIDHIQPISKGGKTIMSNLQVLCSKCNGRKSNK